METPRKSTPRRSNLVGNYLRKRRESLGLSQRALGQLFDPPVTTQFISNVERGVTPLPPAHVGLIASILSLKEDELMSVLEQEYVAKLSGRLGIERHRGDQKNRRSDDGLVRTIANAYRSADAQTRKDFIRVCRETLGLNIKNGEGAASEAETSPNFIR